MAEASRLVGDHEATGTWSFTDDVNLPAGCVDADDVAASANIAHTKLQHRFPVVHSQNTTAVLTDETHIAHIAHRNSRVIGVEVVAATVPTSSYVHTIDVKKSVAGAAFASVLDSALTITSTWTDRVAQAATLGSTSDVYVADSNIISISYATSGSGGTQAKGVTVRLMMSEDCV